MLTPLVEDDPRRVGPFAIHNRIGAGGMGTVYLGFNADGRAAAVKVPDARFADDPEFRERFRREVAAARRVHGRAVAAVLDADPEAVAPWLATEYVEGTSLADAVLRHGRMEERLLHGFSVGLADALIAIHAAGVVHRDLKPSNILLAWDGPKVIDFGIARASGVPSHTRTGILIGTLAWMAPEQLRGERAGPPADIFAWGACVTYAATGHPPFASEQADVLTRMREDRPPDIAGVPDGLAPLVRAALARRPEDRPSAAELVRLLVADPRVATPADADRAAALALTPWQARPPLAAPDDAPAPRAGAVGSARAVGVVGAAAAPAALDPDQPDQPTHPLALRPTPPPGGDRSLGTYPVPRWSDATAVGDAPPVAPGPPPAGRALVDVSPPTDPRPFTGRPTPAAAGGPGAPRSPVPGPGVLRTGAAGSGAGGPSALRVGSGATAGTDAAPGVIRRGSPLDAAFGWLPPPWRRTGPLAGGALLVALLVGILAVLVAAGGSDSQVEPPGMSPLDRTAPGARSDPAVPGGPRWTSGGGARGQLPPPRTAAPPSAGAQPDPSSDPQSSATATVSPSAQPSAPSTERPTPTSGASPSGEPSPSATASSPPSPTSCPTGSGGTATSSPPAC
ncbi:MULTISPECIES: serine/threonine-protein kinase [Frankia]|uniref:Serine-threonine protein kinase n=2 Tax=Frankia TaxID=1854 RepID=Q0RHG9_FRAAA|nr:MULTISPECIES: serine/threonine-protein kinase [Frankia]CAJ63058.1 putative serine-threonine protein kinase [Frankia alni ACN14a]